MTPPKPHRILLDRVSGYADEAAAYMRRRRADRKAFARLYYPGGASAEVGGGDRGAELYVAAGRLIEVAQPRAVKERPSRARRERAKREP